MPVVNTAELPSSRLFGCDVLQHHLDSPTHTAHNKRRAGLKAPRKAVISTHLNTANSTHTMTPRSNPVLAQKISADFAFEFLIMFLNWVFHTIRQSEPPEILAGPA